jgi:tetratricopeptide (TPR) repeat protein
VAVGAAAAMTGDLVFGILPDEWAVVGWTSAAVLVGGLTFTVQRYYNKTRTVAAINTPSIDHLPPAHDLVARSVLSRALLQELADVRSPRGLLPNTPSEHQGQATVVVVHGAAGIGKTTLALHTAHRVKKNYPDARLYIDLRGDGDSPRTSAQALEWFLRSLGVAPTEIPRRTGDRASLFRSLTNPLRALIVLDNAYSTEQILPLIPSGPGCAVLITSRRALSVGNISRHRMVRVELPQEDEALTILAHYAGEERIAEDPAVALELVQFCGRLPLALRIVGARLRARPDLTLRHMRARLTSERSRLRELVYDNESLQACLLLSYRELTREAQQSLGLLGHLPAGRLTNWHVTASGLPEETALPVADELVETCMMQSVSGDDTGPQYSIHDLVRVFASAQYEQLPLDERRKLERRLIEAYKDAVLSLAASRAPELAAQEAVTPSDRLDGLPAAEWVALESDRLVWACERARELGLPRTASLIAESASYFLEDLNLTPETVETLLDHDQPERPRTMQALVRARASLRVAAHDPETALTLLSSTPADADEYSAARHKADLARVHLVNSDFPQARAHMTEAVHALRELNDVWHLLVSLEKLGEILRAQGRPAEAETCQREALDMARRFGDLRATARLRRSLAETLGYLRELTEAQEHLQAALADFRRLRDRRWEAATLYALGKIYRLQAKRDLALECYAHALRIFEPMGERLWVGRIHNARIRVLAGMGRLRRAQQEAERALSIFEELGHTLWYSHTLRDVGWLQIRTGSPEKAIPPLTKAIERTRQAGDAYAEAMARHLRGIAYRETNRFAEARQEFGRALEIYRTGRYTWTEAACAHDFIRALRAEGAHDEADRVESTLKTSNPLFERMAGRNGAVAIPDED